MKPDYAIMEAAVNLLQRQMALVKIKPRKKKVSGQVARCAAKRENRIKGFGNGKTTK